jgi:Protein of unknown function (DUF2934)
MQGELMAREKNPETRPAAKRAPRKRAAAAETGTRTLRPNFVDPQQRAALIARAAYFRAMHRGFAPGHEESDWLAAEAEVDAELLSGTAESSSA